MAGVVVVSSRPRADPGGLTLSVATDGRAAHVRALLGEMTRIALVRWCGGVVHGPSLDDVFLALTGRTTSRDAARDEREQEHAGG